ncbi:hypothetical protein HZ326_16339 [Fusarium oxysporum f. sp. albedinis]|nr:hypothetical protein HZ326_16339 [Fusarium oxysporum f. sp. albedinis]
MMPFSVRHLSALWISFSQDHLASRKCVRFFRGHSRSVSKYRLGMVLTAFSATSTALQLSKDDHARGFAVLTGELLSGS